MKDSIIIGLLQNTAILLSFSMLYENIWMKDEHSKSVWAKILTGIILGAIGIVLMFTPWNWSPGIVFDTRSVMLAISGLFFGPLPTAIAILICATGRFLIGGAGMYMGIAVIIEAGTMGILWRFIRPKWRDKNAYLELLALGFIVHLLMLCCTYFLPAESFIPTAKKIALPLLIIYTPATMLLGVLMLKQSNNWQNRLAKEKLRESERRMSQILKSSNILTLILDSNASILFCNDYFMEITKYQKEELIGKNWFDLFIPTEIKADIRKIFNYSISGIEFKEQHENEILTKDGEKLYISWYNTELKPDKNELPSIACIGVDITKQKTYENKLKEKNEEYKEINIELNKAKIKAEENEAKFRAIFENSKDAIGVSKNGITIFANQAYIDLFGYDDLKEIIEKPVLLHMSPKVRDFMQNNIDKRIRGEFVPNFYESIGLKKNGEEFPIELQIGTYTQENEPYTIAILRDISKRKKDEQILIDAKEKAEESDRLKSAFLQNLSHEIRTPLNAICGFSSMLEDDSLSNDKRKSFVSIIRNSSNQLLSIVSDILTISSLETKQEKIDIQKVNVNSILLELLSIFKLHANNQNISLYSKQTLSDDKSEIYTDGTKLTQILSNLLSNAIKFTHEGSIEFGYNLKNNFLEFYVKDTGIGIDKEIQDKIFERFRQADLSINRKYGGTGLGLSISKGFAELLGGKISVESDLGKGSTFYFTVPYKPVNYEKPEIIINSEQKNQKTILVAEDEVYNFIFIQEILSDENFRLIHAKNGKEAVEELEKNDEISLILMDIKMPVMDGFEATLHIKKTKSYIPVIAQTAYALEHEIEKFKSTFDDYVTKPINKQELKSKINHLLNK